MSGKIAIEKLTPHPKNNYYFTDISGEKYEEVKRSIDVNGIRDPIKCTTAFTVTSGHQRLRIAKELGLVEVPVEIKDVDEWEAEYLLIAENVERRGQAESDPIKKGRIAQFLKEYWGANHGGARGHNVHLKTTDDIAEAIGETRKTTQRLLKLNDLIPEIQTLVSAGKLGTTAAEQYAYITPENQRVLIEALGDKLGEKTVAESKEIRKESSEGDFEKRIKEMEQRAIIAERDAEIAKQQLEEVEPTVVVKEVVPDDVAERLSKAEQKMRDAERDRDTIQASLADTYEELQRYQKRERATKMQHESPLYDVYRSLTATNGHLKALVEVGGFLDEVVGGADDSLRGRLGAEVKRVIRNLQDVERAIDAKSNVIVIDAE